MEDERPSLKVGLLLDSFKTPAWVRLMIEKISHSDWAVIEVIVKNSAASGPGNGSSQVLRGRSSGLYRWYMGMEKKKYKLKLNAQKLEDCSKLLEGVPVLETRTTAGGELPGGDIDMIRAYAPDVLLKIGFGHLAGAVLDLAPHGVWTHHFGDFSHNKNVPPGLWEVLNTHATTFAGVQRLNASEPHQMIYASHSATTPVSVRKNMNLCYWKSASFMPRMLKEISMGRAPKAVDNRGLNLQPGSGTNGFHAPTNGRMIVPLLRHFMKRVRGNIDNRRIFLQWILMFRFSEDHSYELDKYTYIVPPKDRIWADPFVRYQDGTYYIFIEEAPFKTKRGHISVMTIDEKGKYSQPVPIIQQPYHMSYPFLLDWEGELYMIPETSANKTIDVYRCVDFPDNWEFHKTLMDDIIGVDTTLFEHQGKWWLFVNICENEGSSTWDELFLYYADEPLADKWTPHPLNPVVSDTRSARPAGNIFLRNGKIYRPSQNCAYRYGYGLKINEVTVLNPEEYAEKEVESFEPDWDESLVAVHSYNRGHQLTVIDGKIRRPR